ncbi:hypothetical protein Q1695_007010 [Nippostrongylus brasiliensis]|nr:hypothetical protein Q1695_007010 [Nippostrongylus brasiliensis]
MVGKTNETVTTMKRTKCEGRNFFKRYKQIRSIARNGPWINFAFVREPADRFLSGFLHVCRDSVTGHRDCEGCFGDMKCVLRKAFEYSQRFLVDKNVDSHLFWHVSPQNWHCEFRDNLESFKLVQYSPSRRDKVAEDLSELLREGKVNDSDIDVIISQVSNGTTAHATNHRRNDQFSNEMQNEEIKRLLVKVYFWDYILFNFPLPHVEIEKSDRNKIGLNVRN